MICIAILPQFGRIKRNLRGSNGDLVTKNIYKNTFAQKTDLNQFSEDTCENEELSFTDHDNLSLDDDLAENTEEVRRLLLSCDLHLSHVFYPIIYDINPGTFFKKGFLNSIQELFLKNNGSDTHTNNSHRACAKNVTHNTKQIDNKDQSNNFCLYTDCELTAIQIRNLKKYFNCSIYTRKALIIEIFSRRARSSAGKLQVSLAQLTLEKTRLVNSWTHLERQRGSKGSRGFLSGPGEKQIEMDRRIVTQKIDRIKRKLQKLAKTHNVQRKSRQKYAIPIIALVGYTNVGKSTLFNNLTEEKTLAKDQLFATLDTTIRKVTLPQQTEVLISDTVGFISRLPLELITAFRETLNEITLAHTILHVRDISSPQSAQQAKDVMTILENLGINNDTYRIIEIWNKVDKLSKEKRLELKEMEDNKHILICANDAQHIRKLSHVLEEHLHVDDSYHVLSIPLAEYYDISWLYKYCSVIDRKNDANNAYVNVFLYVGERYYKEFYNRYSNFII